MSIETAQKIETFFSRKYVDFPISLHSVWHGFFGRIGGSSVGNYSSLNCGIHTNDKKCDIEQNINTVLKIVNNTCNINKFKHIKLTLQTHSNIPIYIENDTQEVRNIEADAMITDVSNILLAVQTADCVPILIVDNNAKIVASVHSGWRGAVSGIISNTIKMMHEIKKGLMLTAIIGPAIHKENYVVDDDFRRNIIEENEENDKFFSKQKITKAINFDLIHYCKNQLLINGVKNIYDINVDTYSNINVLFSYRYAVKNNHGICGRQLSLIGIR